MCVVLCCVVCGIRGCAWALVVNMNHETGATKYPSHTATHVTRVDTYSQIRTHAHTRTRTRTRIRTLNHVQDDLDEEEYEETKADTIEQLYVRACVYAYMRARAHAGAVCVRAGSESSNSLTVAFHIYYTRTRMPPQ